MYGESEAAKKITALFEDVKRRAGASPHGSCPVELTSAFLSLCLAQSCGKCTPCRTGLARLKEKLERVLDSAGLTPEAAEAKLEEIKALALSIFDSADCAIGFEGAKLVLEGLAAFRDDYLSHLEKGVCLTEFESVPCSGGCPAHVDIPGYIACVGAGRYADAVRVIRKDNPFPSVCGLICEHPCEKFCRRTVVDDAINIRGLKRFAVERAKQVPAPEALAKNGKKVAVVGGGPAGLTAAYFLALKGFEVTVFEKRSRLGGMLRYGIPAYRLPDKDLDWDIEVILSLGVKIEYGVIVGKDEFERLKKDYDAVYLSIGAHGAKKLRIDGENAKGVLSAVELLGAVGEGERPDFSGKRVVIVGGGNVAMDATRTSMRLGAKSVTCVYRRRIADMTALPEEVEGAQAEGCEVVELMAPVRVQVENDAVTGLVVKPQIPGAVKDGRPAPVDSAEPEAVIAADLIVVAIGQDIDSKVFAEAGLETKRGAIVAPATGELKDNVFTGGDCWSGPATVIRAIDAGKIAAANIGAKFGVDMTYADKVEVPRPPATERLNWGRVKMKERGAEERKGDFNLMEQCLTEEEAKQECSRCLRCDCYGKGCVGR